LELFWVAPRELYSQRYANTPTPELTCGPQVPLNWKVFAAWPSVQTLMSVTGLSDRGVQIALQDLQAVNAIQCIYHSRGGGSEKGDRKKQTSTNCYLLTPNSVHREDRHEAIITPKDIPPDQHEKEVGLRREMRQWSSRTVAVG
jgi:hypothetical protein